MSPPEITILVVDDSPVDRHLAGQLMRKAGFVPVFAANGEEALAVLASARPDAIVTDLIMPGVNGLELVQRVRREHPSLPVVLMTAHGSEQVAVEALRAGAASYVPKRDLSRELFSTVSSLVDMVRAERDQTRVLQTIELVEARYSLGNELGLLTALVRHIDNELKQLSVFDESVRLQIGVALREAVVNAIYHGNLEVPSELREQSGTAYEEFADRRRRELPYAVRRVSVLCRTTRTETMIEVADEGPGFDPSGLPDPTEGAALDRVFGRGLLLIRTFMDAVEHNERGNSIRMAKRR